jgi:hypothetical protein
MGPYAGADYSITSPYVCSRVDFNTFTKGNPVRVDLNPMTESTLTLCQSRLCYPPVRDLGFGLCTYRNPFPKH